MSAERITVQLEQLQDTIKEQQRLELLELEPSTAERQDLLDLAAACRDGIETLKSAALGAEYERLLAEAKDLSIDIEPLKVRRVGPHAGPHANEPGLGPRLDSKKVRFSDVSQVFEPEPRLESPTNAYHPYSDHPQTQFDHNNALMMEQDVRLETLGESVRRSRQMGHDINTELDVQNDALSSLEAQTDSAQLRLSGATTRVEVFNRKARESGSCLVITVLTLILFILLVLF